MLNIYLGCGPLLQLSIHLIDMYTHARTYVYNILVRKSVGLTLYEFLWKGLHGVIENFVA